MSRLQKEARRKPNPNPHPHPDPNPDPNPNPTPNPNPNPNPNLPKEARRKRCSTNSIERYCSSHRACSGLGLGLGLRGRVSIERDGCSHRGLCRKRGGAGFGQLALRRRLSAPEHASGCPGQSARLGRPAASSAQAGRAGLALGRAPREPEVAGWAARPKRLAGRDWPGLRAATGMS